MVCAVNMLMLSTEIESQQIEELDVDLTNALYHCRMPGSLLLYGIKNPKRRSCANSTGPEMANSGGRHDPHSAM